VPLATVQPAWAPGVPGCTVWGHTIFRNNEISGVRRAIGIYETEDVLVENNVFDGNKDGVWIGSTASSLPFDPTTITIQHNHMSGSDSHGAANTTGTTIDTQANWWNSPTGPTHATNPDGDGDPASDDLDFVPWLCDGSDTDPAIGFQPDPTQLCGGSPPETTLSSTPSDPPIAPRQLLLSVLQMTSPPSQAFPSSASWTVAGGRPAAALLPTPACQTPSIPSRCAQ